MSDRYLTDLSGTLDKLLFKDLVLADGCLIFRTLFGYTKPIFISLPS